MWPGRGKRVEGAVPTPQASRALTLDALQALRAIAAFMVVLGHSLIVAHRELGIGSAYQHLPPILGPAGVKVFFVISGAVMILSHGDDFRKPGASVSFLKRRAGRIVPLYWLTTLIACFLAPHLVSASTAFYSFLMIPHQRIGGIFGWPIYTVGWTLQYEAFFYLCFALSLLVRRSIGVALIAAAFVLLSFATARGWLGQANAVAYLGRPIIFYFLGGMALGLLRPSIVATPGLAPGFRSAVVIASLSLAAGCAILSLGPTSARMAAAVEGTAIMAAAAACVLSLNGRTEGMATKLARALGDATYSVYLIHAFIVFPIALAVAWLVPGLPLLSFLAIAAIGSALGGLATYRWVEKPLVRRVGRLLGAKPSIGGKPL